MDTKEAQSMMLQAPIPGQSLTDEPGAFAWEQPPMMNDPEEVLDFYLRELSSEEVSDNILDMLDMGVPISAVTGAALSKGVMDGLHTVDVKLIVQPQLAVIVKQMAEEAGIDYKETMNDYIDTEGMKADLKLKRLVTKLQRKLVEPAKMDAGDVLQEQVAEELVDMKPEDEKPQGLMAKE